MRQMLIHRHLWDVDLLTLPLQLICRRLGTCLGMIEPRLEQLLSGLGTHSMINARTGPWSYSALLHMICYSAGEMAKLKRSSRSTLGLMSSHVPGYFKVMSITELLSIKADQFQGLKADLLLALQDLKWWISFIRIGFSGDRGRSQQWEFSMTFGDVVRGRFLKRLASMPCF